MRLRAKKHLEDRYQACADLVIDPPGRLRGAWSRGKPLHLEIGCGKGAFILGMAQKNPDIDFIAMERVKNVIISAMEKVRQAELGNVRFLCCGAELLSEIFAPGEIQRIYLNFSDPWPKKGHAKHRLTHPNFLRLYQTILSPRGKIWQKTDNLALFEFSLQSYRDMNCLLEQLSYDLHDSDFPDNIVTEYEKRFSDLGQPIYRVEASFPAPSETPEPTDTASFSGDSSALI